MRERLAKLAAVSDTLRDGIEKKAFIGKALAALGAVTTVGGAIGKAKQTKAGFDPAAQQAQLGTPPNQ